MSGHPPTLQLPAPERLSLSSFPISLLFAGLALLGILLSLVGALVDPHQFAYSWFFAFYFFFSIALGSFFWVTLHYACDSAWSVVVRRTWENIIGLFPLFFVLFLPMLLPGISDVLWKWMSPAADAKEVALRSAYLNEPFFIIRAYVIYGLYFCLAGLYFRRCSVLQDVDGNPVLTRRMIDHSYLALVIFGVLETFLSFDWLMGLDWRWSSSLFGVYNFALSAQAAMAAGIVLIFLLRKAGYLQMLNAEHFYLMGKLLFGFTIFWAYVAFGQYMLIWYGNIPEETIFYNDHNRGDWYYLTYLIVVGKFMFPTIYLLAQDTKKSLRALTFIASWLLFMHGVELYWFIMPFAHPVSLLPSWQDFASLLTVGSLLGYGYVRLAASASLFPPRDPRLVECLIVTN